MDGGSMDAPCISVLVMASMHGAYSGPYLHEVCVFSMDMHRILVIHAPPHALLLYKQKHEQWAAE